MYIYWYLRILPVSMVCAAEVASWALQIEMVVHLGIGQQPLESRFNLRSCAQPAQACTSPFLRCCSFFSSILDDKGQV